MSSRSRASSLRRALNALDKTLHAPGGLTLALLGAGILLFDCIALASVFVLWLYFSQPVSQLQQAEPIPKKTAPLPCGAPQLLLGDRSLRVESAAPGADGMLPAPPQQADTALWVEGSNPNYLLLLSAANQTTLAALQPGVAVSITWGDCSKEEFVLKEISDRSLLRLEELDQTRGGIALFMPLDVSGRGLLLQSGRPEPPAQAAPEAAEPAGLQADIVFLETTPSADGQTLRLTLEITNTAAAPLALSPQDFSLAPDGAPDQPPLNVEPALPLEIAPGVSLRLTLVFPHPGGNSALFRLKDFTTDLYY